LFRVTFHESQVQHRGFDVLVPEQFLHSPDVHAVSQPLRSAVMPEIMKARPCHLSGGLPHFKLLAGWELTGVLSQGGVTIFSFKRMKD
jgi:hypothetical protein